MGLTWLALGDSITYGVGASKISNAYIYQARKLLKANGQNHFLINAGISGIRSDEVFTKYKGSGGRCDPDLITLMIGTNDIGQFKSMSDFQTNLGLIIDDLRSRKSFGKCYIVLCSMPIRNDSQSANVATWNTAMQSVATSKGVDFVDTNSAFSDTSYLNGDGLHPTDSGHSLLANVLYNKLKSLSLWTNTPQR
jgi:lysophospholipase L1-like esterase